MIFVTPPGLPMAVLMWMPTYVPHEEAYTSLQQGVIDGYMTGAHSYKQHKFYEVCPYFYVPGWFDVCGMCMLVSLDAWNNLPDDLKAILKDAFMTYNYDQAQRSWWQYQKMLKGFGKMGATIIAWPDEEMQKVREASLAFLPEIAKKSPLCAKGVEIIKDYMKTRGYIK